MNIHQNHYIHYIHHITTSTTSINTQVNSVSVRLTKEGRRDIARGHDELRRQHSATTAHLRHAYVAGGAHSGTFLSLGI